MTRAEELKVLDQGRDEAWAAYIEADRAVGQAQARRDLLEELAGEARARVDSLCTVRMEAARAHSRACEASNRVRRGA